ncbi:ABC transporter ATP-binding protein [Bacillus sp. DTU_2020_1000418_1_SI_GHA_SEK_038]|uniref:ABC transporter ATP-binding protein n=1 Tax=Bacillus sp. DTU_2020_1000418_1_SI_GHA_SEK_038 TaxID=3077585 RepID=UPI0028E6CD80|nr:ABC transporter ATP-binding protein [Bacillus sp. DTU_2020_1000418_1_SI_GHA_SEK_038]WNS73857.1 ABC transporter ATP-binding protein [Bacillus sp. DTU_2020_1000418_1_SI_GHA_SEK_038]
MSVVVNVKGLKKAFKNLEVIKGLDFTLTKEKCIALLGANGAGKTTTLQMLSGLMMPTSGSIEFVDMEKGADFRKWIGYLPQHPVFYEWMTGKEFLEYAGQLAGLQKSESKKRTDELLELVGIADAKNRRIGKYSGGMKQRLGIAQAIIHKPKLVMLDEPVSALDPFGRREVLELLEKLKKETTILFSTHILNDAEEVCDEILFLHNGEIIESGSMEELREKHQHAKIELVFRGKADEFAENFSSLSLPVSVDGNIIRIAASDVEMAKGAVLKKIVEKNLPILKFEISRTSLEDVFMKVVQK